MTDEVSWKDLLPCPFCGGVGELRHPVSDMAGTYVFCTNCLAKSGRYVNPEFARRQWNARHASPLRTRIAELERMLGVFLGHDDRFQIMIGGNPAAVEEMMAEARATLNGEKVDG